jgi:hypothetical protein
MAGVSVLFCFFFSPPALQRRRRRKEGRKADGLEYILSEEDLEASGQISLWHQVVGIDSSRSWLC